MKTILRILLPVVALVLLASGSALAAAKPGKAKNPAPAMQVQAAPTTGPTLLAYGDEDIWDENGQLIKKDTLGKGIGGGDVAAQTPDPFEGWNRFWFGFNDKLYFWALKPVAQGYGYVVPERPRIWVQNFFHNLMYPVRFVSLVLQGKPDAAAVETSRVITNTAFGLGGLGDVAGDL